MATNTDKAQQILSVIRSEIGRQLPPIEHEAGHLEHDAAAYTVRGGHLYDIDRFAKLAEDLGDVTSDATDDDAQSIIETTKEHIQSALGTFKYGAAHRPPALDAENYSAVLSYVDTLQQWNAARRFAVIMNGILEVEGPAEPESQQETGWSKAARARRGESGHPLGALIERDGARSVYSDHGNGGRVEIWDNE